MHGLFGIRNLLLAKFSRLGAMSLLILVAASGEGAAPVKRNPVERVLCFPLRRRPVEKTPSPRTAAYFNTEGDSRWTQLVAAGWDDSLYLLDPLDFDRSELRCYDRAGRLQHSWPGPHIRFAADGLAASNGSVWLAPNNTEGLPGISLLAYRPLSRTPVLNWRRKVPETAAAAIDRALQGTGLTCASGGPWRVNRLDGGRDRILVSLTSERLTPVDQVVRQIWLTLNLQGEVVSAELSPPADSYAVPLLSSAGTRWYQRSDWAGIPERWSRCGLWKAGGEASPLWLDRKRPPEAWQAVVPLEGTRPPSVRIDARQQTYLFWARSRRPRAGDSWKRPDPAVAVGGSQEQRALVVLDAARRMVGYEPWQPAELEIRNDWVRPLPDGSGYCWVRFTRSTFEVYRRGL